MDDELHAAIMWAELCRPYEQTKYAAHFTEFRNKTICVKCSKSEEEPIEVEPWVNGDFRCPCCSDRENEVERRARLDQVLRWRHKIPPPKR